MCVRLLVLAPHSAISPPRRLVAIQKGASFNHVGSGGSWECFIEIPGFHVSNYFITFEFVGAHSP